MSEANQVNKIRVWDLPTRLFHWALVLAVLGAVVSAKIGGLMMAWHLRCGYAIAALLVFRLLWGIVGGHWSRFRQFFYTPAAFVRYLRGRPLPEDCFEIGHNPLGALSVLLMLAWLGLQVGSGLIADDEIDTTGPLVAWVSSDTSQRWTGQHTGLGQWGLIAMVAVHVAAILFYRCFKRRNLLAPMISGDKMVARVVEHSADTLATRLFALTLAAACAAAVWLLVNAAG
ncbi:cytochrome b/b6 domain-containing protein [Paucibacter sp. APW11]|uniref:Cytochrome b/b6 domain-containing protein n=1 Tax=Roseateles aquae TaxID=3077235 RepID=A0ABU3PBW7_9BURK|nr:cytochrome b/b6 domain-containing protein [Paucibacter sp. APW11]MDT9000062.1 cytochrome b/b6 domain-containing protein [Paucibacter sp. APW11]